MTTTWTIAIDWDRDGEFTGNDIVTSRTLWVNWFLGFRKPFMDIAENSMLGLVLDNRDRRFSPENDAAANPAGRENPTAATSSGSIKRWNDHPHTLVRLDRIGAPGSESIW